MGILEGLITVNRSRCDRWHSPDTDPWSLADWSNALCGEVGEYANIIKKIRRIDTRISNMDRDLLIQRAGKELADVVIYSALNAQEIGIDLIAAISDKFNEVSIKEGFPERLGRSGQYIV